MAEIFDSATSNLLCSENNSTCFDDDLEFKDVFDGSGISPSWDYTNLNLDNVGSESFVCFVAQSEEIVKVMVEKEKDHLPRDDYLMRLRSGDLDLSVRREALDWIWKVGFISFLKWDFVFNSIVFLKFLFSFNAY
jgi:cyclin D1/2/4